MGPSDQDIAKAIRLNEREAEDRSDEPGKRAGDESEQRERQQAPLVIILAVRHSLKTSPSTIRIVTVAVLMSTGRAGAPFSQAPNSADLNAAKHNQALRLMFFNPFRG